MFLHMWECFHGDLVYIPITVVATLDLSTSTTSALPLNPSPTTAPAGMTLTQLHHFVYAAYSMLMDVNFSTSVVYNLSHRKNIP